MYVYIYSSKIRSKCETSCKYMLLCKVCIQQCFKMKSRDELGSNKIAHGNKENNRYTDECQSWWMY
jgi:hypothetical protein